MQPAGGTANGTVYIRVPFTLSPTQLDAIDNLRLRLRYDDGFIAYLNGTEISRKVVPAALVPSWNSVSGGTHADTAAIVQEAILVPNFGSLLVPGENVLAFHVMNQTATHNDLLLSAQVEYDTFGGAAGSAYAAPITLAAGTTIRTRVLQGTTWSALNEATFFTDTVPASAANLVVSEFSYNPAGPANGGEAPYGSSDFEFIELQNIGAANVDLFNVVLDGAAHLVLANAIQQKVIPPGGRLVVAANPLAFAQRHGALAPVVGPYDGSLDNTGETIRLTAADGSVIKEFKYHDTAPWPEAADGEGYSLVLINPNANPDHSKPDHWRSSAGRNGQPGQAKATTYAAWKIQEGITSDDADPDGDRLSAFAEYGHGDGTQRAEFPRPADRGDRHRGGQSGQRRLFYLQLPPEAHRGRRGLPLRRIIHSGFCALDAACRGADQRNQPWRRHRHADVSFGPADHSGAAAFSAAANDRPLRIPGLPSPDFQCGGPASPPHALI